MFAESVMKILKFFAVLFVVAIFTIINLTISQIYESEQLIYRFGRICGRGALKSFQDDSDMSKFSDANGNMSREYDNFISWLNTKRDYRDVAQYLRTDFADGVTPTNFSVPYVDGEKLQDEFNQQLKLYLDTLESKSNMTMYSIKNIKGEVKSVTKEFQNFNTHGLMYGVNSSFKNNTTGHTKLYDYNSYVSYYVVFEIDYELAHNVTDFFGITNGSTTKRSIDIPIRYELYN